MIAIWCILEACNGQSPCLTESNNEKLCAEMQQLGSSLYDDMLDIDSNVQDAIYRSIEEGGKLLSSAVQFLKSELVNVKASTSNGIDYLKLNQRVFLKSNSIQNTRGSYTNRIPFRLNRRPLFRNRKQGNPNFDSSFETN